MQEIRQDKDRVKQKWGDLRLGRKLSTNAATSATGDTTRGQDSLQRSLVFQPEVLTPDTLIDDLPGELFIFSSFTAEVEIEIQTVLLAELFQIATCRQLRQQLSDTAITTGQKSLQLRGTDRFADQLRIRHPGNRGTQQANFLFQALLRLHPGPL